jgi:hypothetical protein
VETLLVEILALKELMTLERQVCAIADARMDRLEELNRYTGDEVKQKIKTSSVHPVRILEC